VGWHGHIGQQGKALAAGLGFDPAGIAQAHGWIEAAQVGIKGSVAGGGGFAVEEKGAVDQ
jgi:hypothetical protein